MHASDRIRKVEAVVIAHKEYGEADRFVRIFTLQYGKLNTLAKGCAQDAVPQGCSS